MGGHPSGQISFLRTWIRHRCTGWGKRCFRCLLPRFAVGCAGGAEAPDREFGNAFRRPPGSAPRSMPPAARGAEPQTPTSGPSSSTEGGAPPKLPRFGEGEESVRWGPKGVPPFTALLIRIWRSEPRIGPNPSFSRAENWAFSLPGGPSPQIRMRGAVNGGAPQRTDSVPPATSHPPSIPVWELGVCASRRVLPSVPYERRRSMGH